MIYARILNGKVMELFTLPDNSPYSINQLFHPGIVWADVTTVTPEPQPGWSATKTGLSGYIYEPPAAPPPPPPPTLAQQAQAAMAGGLTITSTASPQLNATYAVDPESQHKMIAVVLYAIINQKFPGGLANYPWLDVSGNPHTFSKISDFNNFSTAVADYVAKLDQIIATNTGTLPAASVTIP